MRYVSFFLLTQLILTCLHGSDQVPSEGKTLPDYAVGKTPWRCPSNVKLQNERWHLEKFLQEALEKEDQDRVEQIRKTITEIDTLQEKYARASYK